MKNIHAYGALFALSLVMQSIPGQADLNNSIYVPVEPCRVGNSLPTKVTDGTSVEWLAYGDDMSTQGGAGSPGCPQPKTGMKPIGVALNVTVVGNQATGNGNVVAYPADGATPSGSLVNYKPGTNIANSTIVGLCQDGVCDGKFKLQSNLSDVPVIADVQGYFYPAPGNVANVALSGGDYTSPVDAMAGVANWCGIPSETNQCQIKIAPGTYDIGSSPIVMQSWVSIQGAGQKNTKITGAVSGSTLVTSPLVTTADNVNLTDLSIENTGAAGTYTIAIRTNNDNSQIKRVSAISQNGGTIYGVWNNSGSPVLTNVYARASCIPATTKCAAVYNNASTSAIMTNVIAFAENGLNVYGVLNSTANATMTNVTATANEGNELYGVWNEFSSGTITNVTATAKFGTLGWGLTVTNDSTVLVQNSILEGQTKGLLIDASISSVEGAVVYSKITGGVSDFSGAKNCIGNYNGSLADEPC